MLGSGIGQMNDMDRILNGSGRTNFLDKISLGSLGDTFGTQGFSNTLGALGAAGGIFSAWSGYSNAKKSLKEQKRVNKLLERQMNLENQRYDTELKKRDDAHKTIADSATLFDAQSPFERQ